MKASISRLYINNYRCFVNFEFRPQSMGLLLGYNGTGKSSIFDVLGCIQDLVVRGKNVSEVFPETSLTAFANVGDQLIEIDIESGEGTYHYSLQIVRDERHNIGSIKSERLNLGGKPLYSCVDGEVQLYRDDHRPIRGTFYVSKNGSFLSSVEAKPYNARILWLKRFFEGILIVRFDPARMSADAPTDDEYLARDASNFGSWCRYLLSETPESVERAREPIRETVSGFQLLRTQTVGRSKVVVVKFSVSGGASYELDFDTLSDGQKVLIALYMIVSGAASRATVLCLDEFDNFVSIREIQPFLVELTRLSGEGSLQSLIISHSSEVIDYFGVAESTLLERPDGGHVRVGALSPDTSMKLSELMARGWHVAS